MKTEDLPRIQECVENFQCSMYGTVNSKKLADMSHRLALQLRIPSDLWQHVHVRTSGT